LRGRGRGRKYIGGNKGIKLICNKEIEKPRRRLDEKGEVAKKQKGHQKKPTPRGLRGVGWGGRKEHTWVRTSGRERTRSGVWLRSWRNLGQKTTKGGFIIYVVEETREYADREIEKGSTPPEGKKRLSTRGKS